MNYTLERQTNKNTMSTPQPKTAKASFVFGVLSWLMALLVFLSFIELVPGGILPYAMYPAFIFASLAILCGKKMVSSTIGAVKAKWGLCLGWALWAIGGSNVIIYCFVATLNAPAD